MKRFYVDTCIWIDYFEDRKDNLKPLGDFAFYFLKKQFEERNKIIVSTMVEKELETTGYREIAEITFNEYSEIIEKIVPSGKEISKATILARKINNIPLQDILHAVICIQRNFVLVSRDKHFNLLNVECLAPEELF
jgi:predicted nucleic acid-binding protein